MEARSPAKHKSSQLHRLISELIRLRDHLSDPAIGGRLGRVLVHAARVFGDADLLESCARFAAEPSIASADHVVQDGVRLLFATQSSDGKAMVVMASDDTARQVEVGLQQAWIEPARCQTLEEAHAYLDSSASMPDLIIVSLDLPDDGGLELLSDVVSDLDLDATRVIVVGDDDAEQRLSALSLGAVAFFSRSQLHSKVFVDFVSALFGVVASTGIMAVEDPIMLLPPVDALKDQLRATIEDYGTFRCSAWVLVGVKVVNLGGLRKSDAIQTLRAAIGRLEAVACESCFMARLSSDSFAVLVKNTPATEVASALSDPPPTFEESMGLLEHPPEMRMAAVWGGSSSEDAAIRALQVELSQSDSTRLWNLPMVGKERVSNILVIDDDPVSAHFVSIVLRRHGMAPVWRKDGEEGLLEFRRNANAFAAVLLDLHMPKMDGFQVLHVLRTDPSLPEVPVLVMTGSAEDRHEFLALDRGASDYVHKPVTPDVLLARLRRLVRTHVL